MLTIAWSIAAGLAQGTVFARHTPEPEATRDATVQTSRDVDPSYAGETRSPSGAEVFTEYGSNGWQVGQLIVASGPSGAPDVVSSLYAFDGRGLLKSEKVTLNGGAAWKTTWTRPTPSQLSEIHVDRGGPPLGWAQYEYDLTGWLQSKHIAPPMSPDQSLSYGYDALGRVVTVHATGGLGLQEGYSYDAAGNLTGFTQDLPVGPGYSWSYAPETRFGEIPSRTDWGAHGVALTETQTYDAHSRLTGLTRTLGGTTEWQRAYGYDGSSRLVEVQLTESGTTTETSLHYDVDDQVVREERGATVIRRFQGYRRGPSGTRPDVATESVTGSVLLRTLPNGVREWRYTLRDLDQRAVLSWMMSGPTTGVRIETEVTGAYGSPLLGVPSSWSEGDLQEIDHLHGSEVDPLNEVVHFGARHMLHRDGMWLQPEPLLYTPQVNGLLGSPGAFGRQYAAGNPVLLSDPSGRTPKLALGVLAVAEVAATAYDIYDIYDIGSTVHSYGTGGGASAGDVALSVVGAAAGLVLPGGGYSAADDVAGVAMRAVDNLGAATGASSMIKHTPAGALADAAAA